MEKDLKYVINRDGTIIIAESRTLDSTILEKISKQDVDNRIKNLLREFNIVAIKEREQRVRFERVLNNAYKISMETLQAEINSLTASIDNFLNCLAKEEAERKEIVIATLTGTFDGKGKLIGIRVKINEKFRPQSEQAM